MSMNSSIERGTDRLNDGDNAVTTIKLTDLAAEVRKVAQENPERTAKSRYLDYGVDRFDVKRCVVGEALHNLGVSDDHLHDLDSLASDCSIDAVVEGVIEGRPYYSTCPLTFDNDVPALEFLTYMQQRQDDGVEWGYALKAWDEGFAS